MRIAFLTPEYITEKNFDGGLSNYLGRTCPMLVNMGQEVTVFVASDQSGNFTHNGVQVRRVTPAPAWLPLLNRFTAGRLVESIFWALQSWQLNQACSESHREQSFDLVQYSSYMALSLFRVNNVPAVVRISSYEPLLQNAYKSPRNLDNYLKKSMEEIAIRRADAVFGPSRLIAGVVEQAIGRSVKVIESPFAINTEDRDTGIYSELLATKSYLLFYGTLGILKGIPTIAEIIRPLLERHPALHFVFIGKNTCYLGRQMIEHVLDKAGLCRDRVLYLGTMRQNQIYPILTHAAAVVLPSRIDNLPNTCIEAMACERVVIGTKGASFEELIEDGESGFLCSVDAPAELLTCIEKALALPESIREQMGKNAAKRVAELRPEITVSKLIDFYRSVVV